MTAVGRLRTLVFRAMLPVMSYSATIFSIAVLWSSMVSEGREPAALTSPQAAAEQITQCGAGAVDIRYDDLLQSYVLTVRDATEAQLRCVETAAGYHEVELQPELQKAFDEIRAAKYSAVYQDHAVAWLSSRGLLDKVPKFRAGVTDVMAFSGKMEMFCGPAAKGALQSEYGPRTISPEWLRKIPLPPRAEDDEAISCLMATASVAGFELSFIGNEAFAE
ncbi:hypothetical protein [Sphingopyxis microcysteis]|uniref:hypothetical protein n=1 Tax=Sphingopyxis microcysteis TaxID=2484145 RepID=UPI001448690F|nr:hypothetical protein [Sphingopyxis microcysteis]